MTQVGQIKAEIKRLNNKYKYLSSIEAKYKTDCYADLLSFINALPEEKPSEDLERAANDWVFDNCFDCDVVGEGRAKEAYIAGAERQKEQMLKDVITCEIEWYDGLLPNFTEEQINMYLAQHEIAVGDKVKIIIVKED